ncbi:MAG: cysteine desulfurase family protein [Flavobacteriaceae bacterium]|nr:cysteine desulfurase family protein [Flavobacteriaceae bacterium]MDZ4148670.1 cysteine desulfurase family protein [Flavobacteriaceae bacterium]
MKVYLDNAATTAMYPEVIEKMVVVMQENFGNPSSTHGFGRMAKTAVETARKNIAKLLGVSPGEIIFTSGGTEADNQILQSAVRHLGVRRIITTKIEHHAVTHTVESLQKEFGIEVVYLSLQVNSEVDYEVLASLLKGSQVKTLVSLMHVNNEIGTLLDIHRVGNLCRENNALFHSDTVQSVGHFPMNFSEIPVDFATAAAHKFHGPKGVGFAFVRKSSGLKPVILGGEQERGLRAGTESVHNIVGLSEALTLSLENLDEERAYISDLKCYFMDKIRKEIPQATFNGLSADADKSTYTLVNVLIPMETSKAGVLLFHLDLNGIACSKGSACQSGSQKGSHVLAEILSETLQNQPSLRFSFSKTNTREELDYVVSVIKKFIEN